MPIKGQCEQHNTISMCICKKNETDTCSSCSEECKYCEEEHLLYDYDEPDYTATHLLIG